MWELDHKEGGVLKNWYFWIVELEKYLGQQGDQTNPEGNQPWLLIGRTDAEAEAPILWPPDAKSIKRPDAVKGSGKEKEPTEDEMVGWHHWHNEHEFEQTPGDSEVQESLACCSPWGQKGYDMT